ncbi:MAG TPA: nuclear transport factor 2 family protein [Caulobacteraceae bacterium]|nr:nuclear transport factor 2 family protein [Caulobacteraceae bacterium]
MTRLHLAGAAISALLAASLGACQKAEPAKPAVDTGKIADAVKADAAQRVADVNAHDPAKYASHFATDAIAMRSDRANAVGPAAIQADFAKTMAATPDLHVVLSNPIVEVAASGDLAVFRATSAANMTDPITHKSVTITRNSIAEYKPQADGSWKIVWSVLSDAAPPDAAAPAPKS